MRKRRILGVSQAYFSDIYGNMRRILHVIAGSGKELGVITGYENFASGGRLPRRRSDRPSAHLQDSYLRCIWLVVVQVDAETASLRHLAR